MFLKISIMFLLALSTIYAKQESLIIPEGMFKNSRYFGEIQNGKLNGQGVLYCQDKKSDKIFLKGVFTNNEFTSGEMTSCKDLYVKNEISYGIFNKVKYERQYKPFYEFTIKGYFHSDKKNLGSLFNDGKDITITFFNTQSYDKIIGKTKNMEDGKAIVDGTLYLLNNKIKEITTKIVIANLDFYGGKIQIKGTNFILDGYIENDDDINDFVFSGVIKWKDNTEYYITKMRFKEDLLNKIDDFKKLSTPIKNYKQNNGEKNISNNLKNEIKIQNNAKQLNINTTDIEFKNNKNYINNNQIIDLEKR